MSKRVGIVFLIVGGMCLAVGPYGSQTNIPVRICGLVLVFCGAVLVTL